MSKVAPNVNIVWQPQPGVQTLACVCPNEHILYGGAAGGGKTDWLLGRASMRIQKYGGHYNGVIFRRSFPQLEEIEARSMEIFSPVFGSQCFSKGRRQWNFPGGAVLKLRALEEVNDVYKYQGHQYCVEVNTPVLMGDGSWLPIIDIMPGDEVMTLQGPHAVSRVTEPYDTECVTATVTDAYGSHLGEQVHPITHPVLLADGSWGSFSVSESGGDISGKGSSYRRQEVLPLGPQSHRVALLEQALPSGARCPAASSERRDLGKCAKQLISKLAETPYRLLGSSLRTALAQLSLGCGVEHLAYDETSCVQPGLQTQSSFSGCYFWDRYRRGEQPLSRSEVDQGAPLPPTGAASPSPAGCISGAPGSIQERTPACGLSYAHPYGAGTLVADQKTVFGSLRMTSCGVRKVSDLTVPGPNHYITKTGLVNKNTDINWDELTQWPSDWWYTYLQSRLRSPHGVPCTTCSTSNPGGPGHHWVKRFFMEKNDGTELKPMQIREIEGESGRVERVVFIPAKIRDNKILVENDPAYVDRLESISDPQVRRALRDGDWSVLGGVAFPELRRNVHIIKNVTPPLTSDKWMATDWGYMEPSASGFAFRGSGGEIILWNEIYTNEAGRTNVGTQMAAGELKDRIIQLETDFNARTYERWLDPQCWEKNDEDPSTFDLLGADAMGWRKWGKGPGSRVNQKQKIHEYLQVKNGKSKFLVCERCVEWWRTMSAVPLDVKNSEDVNTKAEDHMHDMTRGLVCKNVKTEHVREQLQRRQRQQESTPYGPPGGMGGM